MIPPKTDPRWAKLINNLGSVDVTNLVTKMLMTQLKFFMSWEQSEAKKQEAINIAYDFFVKNETIVKDDVKVIFG